jgi:hypothetical protein
MKSPVEIKFDTVCEQYEAQFGKSYGIVMHDNRSFEDHIKIMKNAMQEGKPVPDPSPDPKSGFVI